MKNPFVFEAESFEFTALPVNEFTHEYTNEYHAESNLFESLELEGSGCPPFTPVAVEPKGGGRVTVRKAPPAQEIVNVPRAFQGQVPLHRAAAAALRAMQCAAQLEGLKPPLLQPTSGFRDPKRQAQLWAIALKKYGSPQAARKWVAPPGGSAHQSGRAIDFWLGGKGGSENVAKLRKLPAYHWLVANAHKFGFYPYEAEPWHWEYNPPANQQSEHANELAAEFEDEGFGFNEFEDEGFGFNEFEDEGFGFNEFEDEGLGFEAMPLEIAQEVATTTVPKLLGQEDEPKGQTLYLAIPLGAEKPAKPMTGIFIPAQFKPQRSVDLIVYLHGIKSKPELTIAQYWDQKKFAHFALREGLAQSQRNVILVAPTLGPRSQTQTGWLTKPGGFDKYLEQVLASLAAYGPYRKQGAPALGNIILACHSGGGLPMRNLALGKNLCAPKIKECWGFDCLYFNGDETLWPQWAKARPQARLYVHYQGSTSKRSQALKQKRVPNIFVAPSPAKGHNWVPIHHWRERLEKWSSSPTENEQEWNWGSISNWLNPAKPSSTAPAPAPLPNALALTVRTAAVVLATQEWNRWNKGALKETDPKMRAVLTDYWLTGTGSKRHETNWWSAVPWSAAFISWVMKKAGAGTDFKYAASHSVYTAAAKANRLAGNTNMFKAFRITEVAPRIGDLVCKARAGSGATYDNIRAGMKTHCDIVTSVTPNQLTTIGGNVSNSVSQTIVKTDAAGKIVSPGYFAVIRVGD